MIAVLLWVAHTHALEHADATPYLAVSSPAKQSGKTRLLECLSLLAFGNGGIQVAPTASTIFRTLDATPGAALLLDELDAVFRDHSDRYEELRGVINAGHRRGATVPRNVPGPNNTWVVKAFPVFGPRALAGIGRLPDTIADRSIPIRMVKRKESEPLDRFRHRDARAEAEQLVADVVAALKANPPAREAGLPAGSSDRAADAWEPLLAIADVAGGAWPSRARRAATVLHASRARDDSLGPRLITRHYCHVHPRGARGISAVRADEEGPTTDWRSGSAT